MSIYVNQIKQLIAMQGVDDKIYEIKKELGSAPKELEDLQKKFKDVEARRLHQQDKMGHLKEQEKRLGIEIEDDSLRLKKSKSKLMSSENAKEYHAVMREMDSLERVNKDREQEKTALIEELILQKTNSEEIEKEYAEISEQLSACQAGLQGRLDKAGADLAELMAERAKVAAEVPMPIFTRYEFIRERLEHPVIVPVVGGICSGCNISIPPQGFIELQKGKQILSCPNCQRLMYWETFLADEELTA